MENEVKLLTESAELLAWVASCVPEFKMILGSMEYDTGMYGPDSRTTTCANHDPDFHLYEALNHAIQNLKAEMPEFE